MLTILSLFLLFCFLIGISQYSYLGGSPIINLLFMMLIISPPILFFLVSYQLTMPIMYVILLGSSLVITIRDRKKISSATGRYAMDYQLIFIALPVAATGAIIGGLMKNLLADAFIIVLLVLLMVYLLWKGFKQNTMPFIYYPAPVFNQYLENPLLNPHQSYQMQKIQFGQQPKLQQLQHPNRLVEEQQNPQLKLIIAEESNRLPKPKIKIFILILVYTIAIVLGKQASSTQLIVINPSIEIPDDFEIENITINATPEKKGMANILGIPIKTNIFQQIQQKQQINTQNKQQRSRFQQKINKNLDTDSYDPQVDVYVNSSQITSCVVSSLIFLSIHLILSYLSSKSVAIQISTKDAEKQKHGFVFLKQTDKMSSKKMWNCIISGFFAGFSVGVFGLGGSIVLVPAWMNSGVDEQTALISSTPVTFFASLTALILTIPSSQNILSFALIVIILILAILSTVLVNWLANKYTLNRDPKYFRNRTRKILYISSIVGLIIFGIPAYALNRRFTNFGTFC